MWHFYQGRESACKTPVGAMFNPLRCPIVLIALFVVMLSYVHLHHRRATRSDTSMSDQVGRVNLRGSEQDGFGASIVRTKSTASPEKQGEVAISHRQSSRAVPLPSSFKRSIKGIRAVEPTATAPRNHGPSQIVPARDARFRDTAYRSSASDAPARIQPQDAPRFDLRRAEPQATAPQPATARLHRHSRAYTRRYDTKESPARVVMHRIVDGDSLKKLAERYLHDESRYVEIFQANQHLLVQEDLLPLGERLLIPLE